MVAIRKIFGVYIGNTSTQLSRFKTIVSLEPQCKILSISQQLMCPLSGSWWDNGPRPSHYHQWFVQVDISGWYLGATCGSTQWRCRSTNLYTERFQKRSSVPSLSHQCWYQNLSCTFQGNRLPTLGKIHPLHLSHEPSHNLSNNLTKDAS